MKPVKIDTELCIGCGFCSRVCPYRAITVKDGKARYQLETCFACGHCSAVCPQEAVSLPELVPISGMLQCEETAPGTVKDNERNGLLLHTMAGRRSCRNYKADPVSLELLQQLAAIGTTAPSGTNSQPWNFILLPERSDVVEFGALIGTYFKKLNRLAASTFLRMLTRLFGNRGLTRYYENHYESVKDAIEDWDKRGEDRLFHGAAAAILVTAKKDASCPVEDALLATQNIILAAHSMGLGSCLIGFAVEAAKRDSRISRALEIPEGEILCAVIGLGYPEISYSRPAVRKKITPRIFRFDKEGER